MKRMLMVLCLAAIVPAHADEFEEVKEKHGFCTELSELAETIMDARQNGVSMSSLMDLTLKKRGTSKLEKHLSNIQLILIQEAYAMPRFHASENIRKSVQDFKNQTYLLCIEPK